MSLFDAMRYRLRTLLRASAAEREREEEFAFHHSLAEQELLSGAVGVQEARHAARREFGNATYLKEEIRQMGALRWIDTLRQDLRFSARLLWKEKTFSGTVLLTLAVCVGANAAIFSVVYSVLLEPLPFADADRLVVVYNSYPGAGVPRVNNSPPDYFIRRERVRAFESIAQFQNMGHTVGEAGATERVSTMRVTASFFPMLGVRPELGRVFREEEMDPGNEQVVILSHSYWQERFAGDSRVLERDLRVDGRAYRIVGVMPRGFRLPQNEQPRFYVPIPYPQEGRGVDGWHSNQNYEMWAKLRPGVSVTEALADNAALDAALIADWPVPNAAQLLEDAGYHTVVAPARADLVRDVRSTLYLLWGGAISVLLIGCVNIAGLLLARSHVRLRETATRLVLGAPRRRLAREVLTHALFLSLLGGLAGVLIALLGIPLLSLLGAAELPRGAGTRMDATVLLFTFGLAVAAGFLLGVIPSIHLMRTDLRSVLNAESRAATASRRTLSVRTTLVTAQLALAFLLLIGAGLMLASFRSALAVQPGFQPNGVFTASIAMAGPRYAEPSARVHFTESLLAEMRTLPGVRDAALTTLLPFSGVSPSEVVLPEGYSAPAGESLLSPLQGFVTDDYFQTMRIPILEGRTFEPADGVGDRRVIILDEWLARRYFPDVSPIGRRMLYGVPEAAEENDYYTIVGVVGTIKHGDLTAEPGDHVGAYYFPWRQQTSGFASLVIRSSGQPQALTALVRQRLARLDPELPIFDARSMSDRVNRSLTSLRASMFLLLMFAGAALFLSMLGIYGMLAYAVAQRTREMGIRMALGGRAAEIFLLVIRHGVTVTGIGLLLGGIGAAFMGRLIRSLLFGVQPLDPVVLASVAALLATVAIAACIAPAIRATRVNPVRALVSQ